MRTFEPLNVPSYTHPSRDSEVWKSFTDAVQLPEFVRRFLEYGVHDEGHSNVEHSVAKGGFRSHTIQVLGGPG